MFGQLEDRAGQLRTLSDVAFFRGRKCDEPSHRPGRMICAGKSHDHISKGQPKKTVYQVELPKRIKRITLCETSADGMAAHIVGLPGDVLTLRQQHIADV